MRLALAAAILTLAFAAGTAAGQSPPPQPPSPPDFTGGVDPSIQNGKAQRRLDTARRRWRRARIHNYRFEVSQSCFCPATGRVVLFVRGDRPVAPPRALRHVATVRRLHRRVQNAIDGEVHDLDVRYDRRGIPRSIGIDHFGMAVDDEVGYSVRRFWRGTRGRGGPDAPVPPAEPAPTPVPPER